MLSMRLHDALKLLDAEMMKHGTPQQKAATEKANKDLDHVLRSPEHGPAVPNPRAKGDRLLHQARQSLHQVRDSLAEDKNHKPLGHVDHSLREIHAALESH